MSSSVTFLLKPMSRVVFAIASSERRGDAVTANAIVSGDGDGDDLRGLQSCAERHGHGRCVSEDEVDDASD